MLAIPARFSEAYAKWTPFARTTLRGSSAGVREKLAARRGKRNIFHSDFHHRHYPLPSWNNDSFLGRRPRECTDSRKTMRPAGKKSEGESRIVVGRATGALWVFARRILAAIGEKMRTKGKHGNWFRVRVDFLVNSTAARPVLDRSSNYEVYVRKATAAVRWHVIRCQVARKLSTRHPERYSVYRCRIFPGTIRAARCRGEPFLYLGAEPSDDPFSGSNSSLIHDAGSPDKKFFEILVPDDRVVQIRAWRRFNALFFIVTIWGTRGQRCLIQLENRNK